MGANSPDRMDVDGAPKGANGVGAGSPVGEVARSDVSLPKRERRRSFMARNQKIQALKDLPHLKDTSLQRREALFQQKLELCSVIFNFDDPTSDKRCDFDPEEDEPVLEASWPHLQVVYEFFLRFIVSTEVNAKVAKKYVDQKFCLAVIDLFDSEDPRERDYLKTILHRIYGKFMSHRSFIRKAISNVFYRFVYETERHNGIGELLEILGSIINGFAMPLKAEHLQFLVRALVPLHKPKCVSMYHQQLSYCITQYVEKDPETAVPIIQGIIKFWPWSCSSKQVIFLNELEEILELMGSEQLQQVHKPLFNGLAKWLGSQHFQVSERSLFLWNNEHLVNNGCLSKQHAHLILPVIYGPLHRNSLGHWNTTVEGLAQKSTFDKVEDDEDLTEIPEEVKYLSQQLDEKDLKFAEEADFGEDEEDDEDAELSPAEWAKKFEREVAEWDQEGAAHYDDEDGELVDGVPSDVEDDRLYVEMPGYDASLSLAESQIGVNEDENVADPFVNWQQGMA
ncbi:unnamed protein product [Phytophthora lilii]|uniref:Unnamed protein product n=1 Tax=Phytophthora lilii TaxID=2077276 RepID=A0A9W7D894_9STRA|nr:unnamed protein product [Phytophthora lilii]